MRYEDLEVLFASMRTGRATPHRRLRTEDLDRSEPPDSVGLS